MLRIVADAVAANGQCVKSIAEIAARAGVCRTTAQNAIRQAARQGLLVVQERRREGRRNDFNIVRIISTEWRAWITRRGGFKKLDPDPPRPRWKSAQKRRGQLWFLSTDRGMSRDGISTIWKRITKLQ